MKFEISHKDVIYDLEWFDNLDIEDKEIYSVSAFMFDKDGKLCLINVKAEQGWTLPGGRVEKEDKSPEDALIREVEEEADIELKNIRRLGYFRTTCRSDPNYLTYNLKFVADIDKIKDQTVDPAHDVVPERIFIEPEQFKEYANWGVNGEFQLEKALEKLKE